MRIALSQMTNPYTSSEKLLSSTLFELFFMETCGRDDDLAVEREYVHRK